MIKVDNAASNTEYLEIRLRKIRFRSTHRGMKELDILLGGFAERQLETLTACQLNQFEALLDEGDNDLFDWITRKTLPPSEFDHDVLHLIQAFKAEKFQA
jgi:antitoxin CptB